MKYLSLSLICLNAFLFVSLLFKAGYTTENWQFWILAGLNGLLVLGYTFTKLIELR